MTKPELPAGVPARELEQWLAGFLQVGRFRDYCPNGIQVEGAEQVGHIVTGVTASAALLREAIARQADTVLVHHGWFWRNEDPRVIGTRRLRLGLALQANLNLFGYHLPLDAHPEVGNNAQLAQVLGLRPSSCAAPGAPFQPTLTGPDDLIWLGEPPAGIDTFGALSQHVAERLGRTPLAVGDPDQRVGRVAWCTGGAQGMFQAAIDAGATVYLTGEASEPVTHLARETGVGYLGAGHHATERYGVRALGDVIAAQFGVRVTHVDVDNPV